MLRLKNKKKGISETELQKVKPKLMEFYDQVETINGKSNNIGTYEVFLVIKKCLMLQPISIKP
jgi:hypothetical protein